MAQWHQTKLVDPFVAALATTAVGEIACDTELSQRLADGIDGLFRTRARAQYPSWPHGSTTDGCVAHLAWRSDDRVLEVFGLTYLDFGSDMFPARARFTLDHHGRTSVTVFIGRLDASSDPVPVVPSKSLFVPVRHEGEERVSSVELIVGRRQVPIGWARAVAWHEAMV